jgi:Mg-chelatase subunit ChlI
MMIGREHELRQLAQLAVSGRPHVVMLAGEPGIGKTRLIQELLEVLPEQTAVLVGHAEPSRWRGPTRSCSTRSTTGRKWPRTNWKH